MQPPVLEIGFGTGANFHFYKDIQGEKVGIEKSKYMIERFRSKFKNEVDTVKIYIIPVEKILDERWVKNSTKFKTIISTLTLCSVDDLEKTLTNIKELLDSDGIFYVLEHVRSRNEMYAKFQDAIHPVWKLVGDGCNINRNTDVVLRKFFQPVEEEYFFAGIDFYMAKLRK